MSTRHQAAARARADRRWRDEAQNLAAHVRRAWLSQDVPAVSGSYLDDKMKAKLDDKIARALTAFAERRAGVAVRTATAKRGRR